MSEHKPAIATCEGVMTLKRATEIIRSIPDPPDEDDEEYLDDAGWIMEEDLPEDDPEKALILRLLRHHYNEYDSWNCIVGRVEYLIHTLSYSEYELKKK